MAKPAMRIETDGPYVLRQAIIAYRKGGVVSLTRVYGGFIDKVPMGAAFNKGLTFNMGQTHVMCYMQPLMERIQRNDIDPSFVITHRLGPDEAPRAYEMLREYIRNKSWNPDGSSALPTELATGVNPSTHRKSRWQVPRREWPPSCC